MQNTISSSKKPNSLAKQLDDATSGPQERLDSLTSLRFIAAAMIIGYHSLGHFKLAHDIESIALSQGVSFFFVLSGFIMTYVHRELKNFSAVLDFLSARIARIWPVFCMSALLMYFTVPGSLCATETGSILITIFSQFFLVHGWIPVRNHYFALNAPSWSVSTEFFFYLVFPLLLTNLRKSWLIKLLLVVACSFTIIATSHILSLPLESSDSVSQHGLVYINPLSRLFEFFLGMLTCLVFIALRTRAYNRQLMTILEVVVLGCIAYLIINVTPWIKATNLNDNFSELAVYLKHCSGALVYALLIVVIGLRVGYLSIALSAPFLVFLGEISYSAYLLHYPLLNCYIAHAELFTKCPRCLRYILFWAFLLVGSYLSYFVVEKPMRKLFKQRLKYAEIKLIECFHKAKERLVSSR